MLNNIHLNPFAISNLLIILTCFPLAFIIFVYGKTKLSKIYCLHTLMVGMWGVGAFFASTIAYPQTSLIWWRIACSFVTFIPIFFLHTIFLLTSQYNKPCLLFSYIQGIIFLLLILSGLVHKEVKFMFNSYYIVQGGIIFLLYFVIWFLLVLYGHYLLFKFIIKNKDKSYLFFIVSTIFGFGGGSMNFLPAFNVNIYPFGNFLIPFYFLVITYAIFKYQILNVNIFIQRSFVYSILIAFLTATYFIFVFLAEKLFQGMFGYTSLFISILYAFVIALFFTPVKNKIQHLADKIFLGKDPLQIAQENELMKQELERSERLKAVAHFASGLAHEIKNPLTSIKTFAEYLPEKKNDPEFLDKFSNIVSGEVDRIDSLVHQLLDFAKPSPLKLEETDIHKLLDETLDLLSNDLIKNKIKLEKNYFINANLRESNANLRESNIRENPQKISGNPRLKVDSNRLKQTFLNIFLNAIEAMPSGGTLTVSTNLCSSDNKSVLICVQDTGCGINDKDIRHIFEPFFSKKENGTGLGMSIVYNIIKEHKGSIKVESKSGQGASFIIELPVSTG